ncbi:MAG: MATE family efflux transporter [Veillonellaceae bacterium]|nr:MATE family efflux transporter [Veillonellaceae bacterium]
MNGGMYTNLTRMLADKRDVSRSDLIKIVLQMSLPAILAQMMTIMTSYIDAAMAGSLGAEASAAIGLVASTTWLFGGMCVAVSTGFSIQSAQLIGAGERRIARHVLRQAIIAGLVFSLLLMTVGVMIAPILPRWLGGSEEILSDAIAYFMVFSITVPVLQIENVFGSMLQSSGNIRTPSIINGIYCLSDIFWNFFLIYPSRTISVFEVQLCVPGAGLGVTGAALGTSIALVISACMMFYAVWRSPVFRRFQIGSWRIDIDILKKAVKLGSPVGMEFVLMNSAMVAVIKIIAPLGAVAIAANSFGVTAESFCYMPGYGIAAAASPLIGQSLGAGRFDLLKRFAHITISMGMIIMGIAAVIMYIAVPWIFAFLTPDHSVRALGVEIMRIEMWAEPLFGAAIVSAGVLRGAGDTLVPAVLNLCSVWIVRIPLTLVLVSSMGLYGAWTAMCIELCCRGIIMLIRVRTSQKLRAAA